MPPELQPEQKADTVVAQQQFTQWQALRAVGWVQPIDFVMVFLIFMTAMTAIFWSIFSEPTGIQLMTCAIVGFTIGQLWLVLLIFRCSHFVLVVQASFENLPYEAARIAMAGIQGRPMEVRRTAK